MLEDQVIRLNRDNAVFSLSDGGFLKLEYAGKSYSRVFVIRAFPFTDPDIYISVRDDDMNEIGIIENIADFEADTVALIKSQIDIRYFTPKITRINSIKDKGGIATFDCETDKGHAAFSFRIGGAAVSRLSETRLIFTDNDNNRYEIPDISALSAKEQKKLDLYI